MANTFVRNICSLLRNILAEKKRYGGVVTIVHGIVLFVCMTLGWLECALSIGYYAI